MTSTHKDYEGAKLGMWLFLFTEVLLFGGLFVLYSVYLHRYHPQFHEMSKELDVVMGTTNTIVLITSSLFVALGVAALKLGDVRRAKLMTLLTIAFAGVFLVIKYFEWTAKFHHGLYPGAPELAGRHPGDMVFLAMYFTMTGLHGLHVIIGMAVLGYTWWLMHTGKTTPEDYGFLENAGLYWHLVDLIWIYLFPLYYLIT